VNGLVKVSKVLVHGLVLFVFFGISFWVAGQRESKDGFPYFVTAIVVLIVLWAVYYIVIYLLSLAWSRWRRSTN